MHQPCITADTIVFVSHICWVGSVPSNHVSVISKAEEKGQLVCLMAFQGKDSRIQGTRLYRLSHNGGQGF